MNIKNYINFYKACYQADNRELSLWNVSKLKADCYWLATRLDDLATNTCQKQPLPTKLGLTLHNKAQTYLREKCLIYGTLFVVGTINKESRFFKDRSICSPLVYYYAYLETENDACFLSIDITSPQINLPLVRELIDGDEPNAALDALPLISGTIDKQFISDMVNWLDQHSIALDSLQLLQHPKALSATLRQAALDNSKTLQAVPLIAVILVDRPAGSRGIVHELELLADTATYASPIKQLFHSTTRKPTTNKRPTIAAIPGLLSNAQETSLNIAAAHTLGLISGPPGTGKSYTIAALAVDRMLQGETTLIVSETEQAVNVIQDKLTNDFHIQDTFIRAGEKALLRSLKENLNDWLNHGVKAVTYKILIETKWHLRQLKWKTAKKERAFIKRAQQSMRWGATLATAENTRASFSTKLLSHYIRYRIAKSEFHWTLIDDIQQLLSQREQKAAEYIKLKNNARLHYLLNKHRTELAKFNRGIRARTSSKQQDLFDSIDYNILLSAFPIWLVSLDTLHKVLPLQHELFDLVVIDEATQCNIASVLPAMQRAKRVLIVGDSKQLRHISFLSTRKERQLLEDNNLSDVEFDYYSYRLNSILDLLSNAITTQKAIVMLDEHYRSKPDLIAFCNARFYNNRLKIMQHRPGEDETGNIIIEKLDGKRDRHGINKTEATAVQNLITTLVSKYQDNPNKPSIGVISPFRAQADYLAQLVGKQFSPQVITDHNIRVATPYGFQGDERDFIILSLAIDNNSLQAAAYLNRGDMFNVTMSRARQKLYLFLSIDKQALSTASLLYNYLDFVTQRIDNLEDKATLFEESIDAFVTVLQQWDIKVWKHFPVAGRSVDVFCQFKDHTLAIDLIGFPGEHQNFLEVDTYKLFYRAGLRILPISYGLWRENQSLCLQKVKQLLAITTM